MIAPLLSSPGVNEQLFVETTDDQAEVPADSVKEENETEKKSNEDETFIDDEQPIPFNWKKELPCVIRSGDIDRLEEIMEAEDFDINTTWFQENLLMMAIRAGQTEMAEFLIDNGINYNFTRRTVLDYQRSIMQIDCYMISCRQLAYDHQMTDIVNLIDQKNKQLFSFIKLRQRTPRIHLSKKLAADDGSDLDVSAGERLEQEKKAAEFRQQSSSDSYIKKGLNLHRLTPDLVLHERKKGQQMFLPFYKNFPTSGATRNCLSSRSHQDNVTLGSLSNSSLTVRPQRDASFDWSFKKKDHESDQSTKPRLTATCWAPKNNSGRILSIERQFQQISCGNVTHDRTRTRMPTPCNGRSLTYENATKWKDRPKSWIP